jgi:hypothetical protein
VPQTGHAGQRRRSRAGVKEISYGLRKWGGYSFESVEEFDFSQEHQRPFLMNTISDHNGIDDHMTDQQIQCGQAVKGFSEPFGVALKVSMNRPQGVEELLPLAALGSLLMEMLDRVPNLR